MTQDVRKLHLASVRKIPLLYIVDNHGLYLH